MRIRTSTQVKAAEKDDSGDFSSAQPVTSIGSVAPLAFALDEWAARARKLSAEFSRYPEVLTSAVTVMALTETKYFVSSEGSRLVHGRGFARVMVSGVG